MLSVLQRFCVFRRGSEGSSMRFSTDMDTFVFKVTLNERLFVNIVSVVLRCFVHHCRSYLVVTHWTGLKDEICSTCVGKHLKLTLFVVGDIFGVQIKLEFIKIWDWWFRKEGKPVYTEPLRGNLKPLFDTKWRNPTRVSYYREIVKIAGAIRQNTVNKRGLLHGPCFMRSTVLLLQSTNRKDNLTKPVKPSITSLDCCDFIGTYRLS